MRKTKPLKSLKYWVFEVLKSFKSSKCFFIELNLINLFSKIFVWLQVYAN